MFRTEERHQLNAVRFMEQINGGVPIFIGSRVICDQPNFQAAQLGKTISFENINPVQHLAGAHCFYFGRGFTRGERTGDITEIKVANGFRRQRAEFTPKGNDIAAFIRMIPVGEKDHEGFRKGVDPNRSARPAGMPE